MKRPGLTPHFLSATLFLSLALGENSIAQEKMTTDGSSRSAQRAEELLKRYDKNGDGRIDDDERAEAKEAMMKETVDRQTTRTAVVPEKIRERALEMFDRNRDGRLDDEERVAAQTFAESRQKALQEVEDLTKRFDKNSDGRLDPAERDDAAGYLTELRSFGSQPIRDDLIRRFDRNANGKIDEPETAELDAFVRPRIMAYPNQLRRHDKNEDDTLDDGEWSTARAAIVQWLNGAGPAALGNEGMREDVLMSRFQRVSEEVARRRALREQAMEMPFKNGVSSEQDKARLRAVADEVMRRRAVREASQSPAGPTK